jgi:siderophore synthetase component
MSGGDRLLHPQHPYNKSKATLNVEDEQNFSCDRCHQHPWK